MVQLPHAEGSFSKCLGSKEKIMLSFLGELSPVWLFRYLPSSSPERKELRRCFEPKVFCFIPTPCWCTSTPCWCAGNYLLFTFSVLSRIVTTFFRLASLLKPVWVYTSGRSSACLLFGDIQHCRTIGFFHLYNLLEELKLFLDGLRSLWVAPLPIGLKTVLRKLAGSLMVLSFYFLGTLFAWR